MELLQMLSPSASHCIKCFCDFIGILCLCRCQSAVKLKLQTEILHFHPQWKLRKPIFFFWQEKKWHDLFNWVILWFWRHFWALILKGRKEGGSVFLLAFSGNLINKYPPRFTDRAFELLWMQPIFLSLSLSRLRLCWRGFHTWRIQKCQQDTNCDISKFSSG